MPPELPACRRCGTNEFVEPDKPRPGERRVPAICCECGATVGTVPVESPRSETDQRLTQAIRLVRAGVLSEWEQKFVKSIAHLSRLSPAQRDKWETIKSKRL